LGAGLTPRARKLRIEYAGAAYHVMARGNQGRDTYGDRREHKLGHLLPTNQGVAESPPATAEPPAEKGERRTWRHDDPTGVYEKLDLANRHGGSSVLRVSATEIIQELPKRRRSSLRRMGECA
jgi:hypothetical protein